MALLDIEGWGKNPIVKNVDNTPLDIVGIEAGEDFSKPSDRLQEIEVWIEGYLAAAEKKYANISSKDPENLSLRIIKGEIIAIKRILQEFQAFMKNGITQEAKIFPHLDSPNPKDKANPPMKKMK